MSKSLLAFSILVDHDDAGVGRPAKSIRSSVNLYREDGVYVWRIGGPNGDEVEALPRPASLAQAQADVRATYGRDGAGLWQARASWL